MLKSLVFLLMLALGTVAAAQEPAPAASTELASTAPVAALPSVEIETSMGRIVLQLYPEKSPKTVDNFLHYVRDGFYDGTVFHRVIAGFLIQGGIYNRDLEEKRTRPTIADEADNGLSNLRGTIAAARAPEAPHSATSQFFINLVDNRRLDFVSDRNGLTWGYTVFGKVVEGLDVIDAIAALPTVAMGPFAGDVPKPLVVIESAHVVGESTPATAASAPAPASSVAPAPASSVPVP